MAGRRFRVVWGHSADELLGRYLVERDGRLVRRWQALWLLRQGRSMQEVAATVRVAYRTIQEWVGWYRTGGLDEVARRHHGGLRRTIVEPLTPDQRAVLVRQASTAGFATVKAAIAWTAEELGVRLTDHQMARQFRQLGLRSKLPRPISDRADPAVQATWKKGGSPPR
jgi:transposase